MLKKSFAGGLLIWAAFVAILLLAMEVEWTVKFSSAEQAVRDLVIIASAFGVIVIPIVAWFNRRRCAECLQAHRRQAFRREVASKREDGRQEFLRDIDVDVAN